MSFTNVYLEVKSGEINVTAAAVVLPDVPCRMVMFRAKAANAGVVYLGGAAVTIPDGTADATSGYPLNAGDESGWIPVANLNLLSAIGSSADDDLSYLAVN